MVVVVRTAVVLLAVVVILLVLVEVEGELTNPGMQPLSPMTTLAETVGSPV